MSKLLRNALKFSGVANAPLVARLRGVLLICLHILNLCLGPTHNRQLNHHISLKWVVRRFFKY